MLQVWPCSLKEMAHHAPREKSVQVDHVFGACNSIVVRLPGVVPDEGEKSSADTSRVQVSWPIFLNVRE